MGRPTDCTPEVQAVLIEAVSNGSTNRLACMAAGISETSLHEWRNRGADGEEPYTSFAKAFAQAEAAHAASLLSVLNRFASGAKDERVANDAAKFLLASRYRKDYGTAAVEVENVGGPSKVVVELAMPEGLTGEERIAALRAMVGK